MAVSVIPAVIIQVKCDKCGFTAPDVATIPIAIDMVRQKMMADGWTFHESVLHPPTPPTAACPKCAKKEETRAIEVVN